MRKRSTWLYCESRPITDQYIKKDIGAMMHNVVDITTQSELVQQRVCRFNMAHIQAMAKHF